MKKIGFIINPIAGMGGSVGLKGTDDVLKKALELGATYSSYKKAEKALLELTELIEDVEVFTCSGNMGEAQVRQMGFHTTVVDLAHERLNSSNDTKYCISKFIENEVDLILFAGGDGTARDVYSVVGEKQIRVLGIPAGVKIHSPVYAQNPTSAGTLAKLYLQGKVKKIEEVEVLDIDEEEYRNGNVNTKLFGYLHIPFEKKYVQNRKSGTPMSERATQNAISFDVIDNMEDGVVYIIGPGSTTRPIMENLNLQNTLLGVDAVLNKEIIGQDLCEKSILQIIKDKPAKLVVTPTGGQGYLFGRGNQQISSKVIEKVGRDNIIILATKEKISSLRGRPFLVDTGDDKINLELEAYMRITTGYREKAIYRLRR
jgi:predicted polyphosphate/ATP-dependent NAD kinase